jgi:hypothetical protein
MDIKFAKQAPIIPKMGDIHHNPQSGEIMVWSGDDMGWVSIAEEGGLTKEDILEEFERNPELYNEVMVEMRNRKINKLK